MKTYKAVNLSKRGEAAVRPGMTPEERAAQLVLDCDDGACPTCLAQRQDIAAVIRAAVADAEERARAEERERCIADCHALMSEPGPHAIAGAAAVIVVQECERRIRARGERP